MAPTVFEQHSIRRGIAQPGQRSWPEPGRARGAVETLVGLLVLLGLAGAWNLAAAEPPWKLPLPTFTVRVWSSARELPGLVVHDLAQTTDGYLWAATRGGLRRNNSIEFNPVPLLHADVEADSQPVRLHPSPVGDLWAATAGRRIVQIGAGEPRQWELPDLPGLEGERCFATAPGGPLWLIAGEWLFRKEPTGFIPVARSEGKPMRRCACGPDGRLWVVGAGVLMVLSGQTLEPAPDRPLPEQTDLRDLIWTPDGTLWLAAPEEVLAFAPAASAPAAHGVRNEGRGADVRRLLLDGSGRLWAIGARSVHCWMGRSFWEADIKLDPQQGHVLGATADNEGSLWLAFDQGGVAQLVATPARWFNPLSPAERARRGLSAAGDAAVVADREGTVWLANSWGGLAYVGPGERWTPIPKAVGPDGETARLRGDIRVLTPARTGGIWAGTAEGRLYQVSTRGAVRIEENLLAGEGRINALHEGHDGQLAVARIQGNAFLLDTTGAPTSTDIAGLLGNQVRHFFTGKDGTLWAGGDRVWRITDGSATPVPVRGWAGPIDVVGFCEDAQGELWLASRRAGLCCLRQGVFEPLAPASSRIDRPLAGPEPDREGRIWVVTRTGLWWANAAAWGAREQAVSTTLPMHRVTLPVSSQPWSLEPSGNPALACDARGMVWLATTLGAILINPAALTTNARPPIMHITGVRADGLPVPDTRRVVLPANTKRLEVDFDTLAFAQPEIVRVLARMGGPEAPWREVTGTRTLVWDQPPPGQHELQLRAFFDHQEHQATTTALPWRQRQPWWRDRSLFVILPGLLLGALSFHLWMTRRIDRRQLAAVRKERERLARELHDTVEQGLQVTALRLSALAESLTQAGDPSALASRLGEIRETTLHTLTEARRAVWELAPDQHSSATLAQALEADALRLIGKSTVGLDWSATGLAWPISAEIAQELRRIQNEAVTNALKHAESSEITIRLAWLPASLTLEVRDDGRGFDPIEAQTSGTLRLGLQGMQARATRLNATWSLDTRVGEGTCIRVTLPHRSGRPPRKATVRPAPASRPCDDQPNP